MCYNIIKCLNNNLRARVENTRARIYFQKYIYIIKHNITICVYILDL